MGKTVIGVALVVIAGALLGQAQLAPSGSASIPGPLTRQVPFGEVPASDRAWNAKRLRALNADRQKSMISDVEKLLKLARQLDAEVATNPGDELTPSQLHKVAEIEKLARSVKSKMAMSFASEPSLRDPATPDVAPDGP